MMMMMTTTMMVMMMMMIMVIDITIGLTMSLVTNFIIILNVITAAKCCAKNPAAANLIHV